VILKSQLLCYWSGEEVTLSATALWSTPSELPSVSQKHPR